MTTTNQDLDHEEKVTRKEPALSRRQALLGAILAGSAVAVKEAHAAPDPVSCSCLPAPDCNAVCENGGTPRGDGTQACDCNTTPPIPTGLATVAYTGSYNDLNDRPKRALSLTDGGDAVNATKWAGHKLRLQHNTTDTWIPVFSGENVDYVLKSEIGGALPNIGATTFSKSASSYGSTFTVSVSRDQYGRLTGVNLSGKNCNCNCDCQCGDDCGCFIRAIFRTPDGLKSVEALQPGDWLLGIDGPHRVVGVAKNILGNRRALRLAGDSTVMTEDHIFLQYGNPAITDGDLLCNAQRVLTDADDPSVKGRYLRPWLKDLLTEADPDGYELFNLPPDTPTYSPIVERGCWVTTADGSSLLLCEKVTEE